MGIQKNDFDYVRNFIRDNSAIVLEPGKEYLVETRLGMLARREGMGSLEDLLKILRASPLGDLGKKVVDAMTTNETSFFRDIHPFNVLKAKLLPELIEKRRNTRRLSIWCAASSTGQEPFTIAMVIRENFPELASWQIELVATDLSQEVLQKAKEGKFSQLEVNRGLPVQYLVKYFVKDGAEWLLKPEIKNMVKFQEMNLIRPWTLSGPFDLVFIRNVLIYFDTTTKKGIFENIRKLLRPDAYMFLGSAETTLGIDDNFEKVDLEGTKCYRLKSKV